MGRVKPALVQQVPFAERNLAPAQVIQVILYFTALGTTQSMVMPARIKLNLLIKRLTLAQQQGFNGLPATLGLLIVQHQ